MLTYLSQQHLFPRSVTLHTPFIIQLQIQGRVESRIYHLEARRTTSRTSLRQLHLLPVPAKAALTHAEIRSTLKGPRERNGKNRTAQREYTPPYIVLSHAVLTRYRSQRKFRERKLALIGELEDSVKQLTSEVSILRQDNERLLSQLSEALETNRVSRMDADSVFDVQNDFSMLSSLQGIEEQAGLRNSVSTPASSCLPREQSNGDSITPEENWNVLRKHLLHLLAGSIDCLSQETLA
jgi:hypothetical protein